MLSDLNLDKEKRSPKEQAVFLLQSGNMTGRCLGACLDSCRWGSIYSVMWEMSISKMVEFIQCWMHQNGDHFQYLFGDHEWKQCFGKKPCKQKLPFIDHECCPADAHCGTIMDRAGRVRCGHRKISRYKPSFFRMYLQCFDEKNQHSSARYREDEPEGLSEDAWDENGELDERYKSAWNEYQRQRMIYDYEDRSAEVLEVCYYLIKENPMRPMSLATMLKRFNLVPNTYIKHFNYIDDPRCGCDKEGYLMCIGHELPTRQIVFAFDGWALGFYVREWYKQFQEKPLLWQ